MVSSLLADQAIASVGLVLIFAGFAVLLATVLFSLFRPSSVKSRGGAVVIIGPIPFILASDKQSAKVLLILAIVLVAVVLGLFVLEILS